MDLDGLLVEVQEIRLGSHVTADLSVGETVIPVEDLSDFTPDGVVDIAGTRYAYSSLDPDASTLTLATPATVEIVDLDPICPVVGSQIATRAEALIDLGGAGDTNVEAAGDLIRIGIPYQERAAWQIRAYQPPLPVRVSGDLERIIDVPGIVPTLEGGYIDPDTLPNPGGGGPTDPPAESPTLEITGTAEGLVLKAVGDIEVWTELEYHLTDTAPDDGDGGWLPFIPGPDTLLGTATRTSLIFATALPDGTPLTLGQMYHARVIAKNELGSADPSPMVSAPLDPSQVSTIVAGEVAAGFVLAGSIQVGQITITPDGGIRIPTDQGGITLPADGSDAVFGGSVRTNDLYIEDHLQLNGSNNAIGGLLVLGSSVLPPSPVYAYDSGPENDPDKIVGAADSVGICESVDGASWAVVPTSANEIWLYDKVTGAKTGELGPWGSWSVWSVTSMGGYYYVVAAQVVNEAWVLKISPAGAIVDQVLFTTAKSPGYRAIGLDTIDGLITAVVPAPDDSHWRVGYYDGDLVQQRSEMWLAAGAPYRPTDFSVVDVGRSLINGVPTPYLNVGGAVLVFDDSGKAFSRRQGIATTGLGMWVTADNKWAVVNNTPNYIGKIPLNPGAELTITNTYYDSDPAGSGTHETTESLPTTHTRAEWSYLTLVQHGGADSGDVDSPDSVRFYVDGHLEATMPFAQEENWVTLAYLAGDGAAPPTTNSFEELNTGAGEIASAVQSDGGPNISLKGSGEWRLGSFIGGADGSFAVDWEKDILGTGAWVTVPSLLSGLLIEYRVKAGWLCLRTSGTATTQSTAITNITDTGAIPYEYCPSVQQWGPASLGTSQGMGRVMPNGRVDIWDVTRTSRTEALYLSIAYPVDI